MNSVLEIYLITKLVKLMTVPWEQLPAYELGIIDARGNPLKKSYQLKTAKEKSEYTALHRFAFNLRRLIERMPGGKNNLIKYFTVYQLFKEDLDPLNAEFIEEFCHLNIDEEFEESLVDGHILPKGEFQILHDTLDDSGNHVNEGDIVIAYRDTIPSGTLFGSPIYELITENTGGRIFVAYEDIRET